MTDTTLFNIKQVQKMLGVSERTIFRYIEEGELTGFKIGREWRFTQDDINTFLELRRKKTEEEMRQKEETKDAA